MTRKDKFRLVNAILFFAIGYAAIAAGANDYGAVAVIAIAAIINGSGYAEGAGE